MRSNGRQVNIFVNEIALKTWLTGGKPATRPAGVTRPPASTRATETRPTEPTKGEKAA